MDQRVALITGSSRGIGRAIALQLASDGLAVVINYVRNAAAADELVSQLQANGHSASAVQANVALRTDREHLLEVVYQQFGQLDVLVNNAAVRPSAPFLEVSDEEWQRVIDIDFTAAVRLSRACLPGMIDRGWGRIINFTGMNAQQGYPGKAHVTVAKHAVWGLTKSLSKEFGPHGITTNIISPGTIVGEAVESHSMASKLDELLSKNPAGRLGQPDDIAAMVDLLVSENGGFINGQLLQINGGVVN